MSTDNRDPLDPHRPNFICWFDSRVHFDARGFALRQPPQWSTTVGTLYRDLCNWKFDRSQAPPTHEQFMLLLQELGCSIRTVGTDQFVDYVGLKPDIEGHELFQQEPLPDPHEEALERVRKNLPPPVATAPDGTTPLPAGVRVVQWQLKESPIRLSLAETIIDTEKFVATTLQQLNHHLHGNKFLDGGWGLQGLLDRLRVCGCVVEVIDDPPNGGVR